MSAFDFGDGGGGEEANCFIKQEVQYHEMEDPVEPAQSWHGGPSTSTEQKYLSKPKTGLSRLFDGTFFMSVPQTTETGSPASANQLVGQCVRCLPRVVKVKGYSNCTSNFLTHLRRVHGPEVVQMYKNYNNMRPYFSGDAGNYSNAEGGYQMTAGNDNYCVKPELNEERMDVVSPYQEEDSVNSSHCSDTNEPNLATKSVGIMNSLQCMFDGTFFKHLPAPSMPNQLVGQCMRCLPYRVVVRGYSRSTSNFLSHLKRKHGGETVEEYKQYAKLRKTERSMDRVSSSLVELPAPKIAPKQINKPENSFFENLVKFFTNTLTPLKVIEHPAFLKLFQNYGPNKSTHRVEMLSYQQLRQRINQSFANENAELTIQLIEVEYVCITVDIYPDQKWLYIAATAHWITKELARASKVFMLRKLKSTTNAVEIYNLLTDKLFILSLSEQKIVSVIFNVGINLQQQFTTLQQFGVCLDKVQTWNVADLDSSCSESSSDYESDEYPLNASQQKNLDALIEKLNSISAKEALLNLEFPCSVQRLIKYLLTTYLQEGLITDVNKELHRGLLEKCSRLWQAASQRRMAKKVREILGHKLKRPTARKCDSIQSVFNALQEIYNMREKSQQLHQELSLEEQITQSEFIFLGELLQHTAPITEAINILQTENNGFLGILLPCLYMLRKKLEKLAKKNFEYCQHLNEIYLKTLPTYFQHSFSLDSPQAKFAMIAALSHPRFKNKWLSCVAREEHAPILDLFKQTIIEEMRRTGTAENIQEDIKPDLKKPMDYFDFGSDSETEEAAPSTAPNLNSMQMKAEVLMYRFFGEEDQELEMLEGHPEIKNIFIKYNTIMPVMTMHEKIFTCDVVDLLSRRNQAMELLEKRIIIKMNAADDDD